jgi:hypothetical protein
MVKKLYSGRPDHEEHESDNNMMPVFERSGEAAQQEATLQDSLADEIGKRQVIS